MNDSLRLSPLEDAEALYEADIGPIDIKIASVTLPIPAKKITGGIIVPADTTFSFSDEVNGKRGALKKIPAKGRYEEDELEDESYTPGPSLKVSGTYFDEKEKSMKIEYKLLPGKGANGMDMEASGGDAWREMEQMSFHGEDVMLAGASAQDVRPPVPDIQKYAQDTLGPDLSATYEAGVLNIEYKDVELIGGQKTYQRVVLQAEKSGESVYSLTMRKLGEAGIDVSSEYEMDFESMILTSINGKAEGTDGNFNEFYLNGEIGGNAADKQKLSKGDIVEWRYAEETDGSCGGSPDFSAIKSVVEYSAVAKAQAEYFGILTTGPNPASYAGFGQGLIFH